MATRKVTELVHADLGKHVVLEEVNGDRNSGELKTVSYLRDRVSLQIDNASVTSGLDAEVSFTS